MNKPEVPATVPPEVLGDIPLDVGAKFRTVNKLLEQQGLRLGTYALKGSFQIRMRLERIPKGP